MRRFFKSLRWIILFFFTPLVFAANVPVVPVEMKWVMSYETMAFNTSDGDLGIDEYAVYHYDPPTEPISDIPQPPKQPFDGWVIRTVPKGEGSFTITNDATLIKNKKEVAISCDKCAYYSEFEDDGQRVRIQYEKQEYNNLRYKKDYPQPKKIIYKNILSAVPVGATIALDATSDNGGWVTATSMSWSHTTSGTNRLLSISVNTQVSTFAPSSVTYAGELMFSIQSTNGTAGNGLLYGLVNPTSGTNTITVTFGSSGLMTAGAISLNGARPLLTTDAQGSVVGSSNGGSTSLCTLTTSGDNSFSVSSVNVDSVTSITVGGTGHTQTYQYASTDTGAGGYNGPKTPAGTVNLGWTWTGTKSYLCSGVAYQTFQSGDENLFANATSSDIGFTYRLGSTFTGATNPAANARMGFRSGAGFGGITTGFRLQNITIPKDSTITSATFSYSAFDTDATTDNVKIFTEAADNPVTFAVTSPKRPIDRATSTAGVAWTLPNQVVNTVYTSPDISTEIQAVINRAGWVSGNALVIIIGSDGYSDNHNAKNTPTTAYLTITYTTTTVNTPEVILKGQWIIDGVRVIIK